MLSPTRGQSEKGTIQEQASHAGNAADLQSAQAEHMTMDMHMSDDRVVYEVSLGGN